MPAPHQVPMNNSQINAQLIRNDCDKWMIGRGTPCGRWKHNVMKSHFKPWNRIIYTVVAKCLHRIITWHGSIGLSVISTSLPVLWQNDRTPHTFITKNVHKFDFIVGFLKATQDQNDTYTWIRVLRRYNTVPSMELTKAQFWDWGRSEEG